MARPSRLCYTKDTIKIPEYYNKFIYSFFVFFFFFFDNHHHKHKV